MTIVHAKIINCLSASIRKTPWISDFKDDVVGEKKNGETIEIDTNRTCYDWVDRKFYKTINPKGWIHDGVIDYGVDQGRLVV